MKSRKPLVHRQSLSFNLKKPIEMKELNNVQNKASNNLTNYQKELLDEEEDIEKLIIPYKSKGNINEDSILLCTSSSFIANYLNLIKSNKGKSFYPSILKFPIEINIRDYIQEEGFFFNYVKYELDGK